MKQHFQKLAAKCKWCRDLYDAATPWVQLGGFIILCAFTIGTASAKFSDTQSKVEHLVVVTDLANDRIGRLESQFGRIDQKLDDIKETLHVPENHQP